MGVKTVEVLIQEGVRLAGREYDATDTRPLSDFKDWLESVALGWPWDETINTENVILAAGSNAVVLGVVYAAGLKVHRVLFPMWVVYGEGTLPDKITQEPYNDAVMDAQYYPVGIPTKASYKRVISGAGVNRVGLLFNRRAKTDLTIQVKYQYNPAEGYDITSVPWYPNDITLKTAIAFHTARHHDGVASDKALKLEDDLSIMIKNDKLKFGVFDSFTMKMDRNPRNR